jgi:ribosomal protein S8
MIGYESNAYVINNINLSLSKKMLINTIILNKKTLPLVKMLHQLGCVHQYNIIQKFDKYGKKLFFIKFSAFFYKNTSFFKGLRLVSTGSKKFNVTLKALHILNKLLKSSTLILSTSKGLMTHKEALKYKIGGLIICSLS